MKHLSLILKGLAMGLAEVIPGVSGGTIAFITGIYERLINAIKSFSPLLIKTYKTEGLSGVIQAIDLWFLIKLFSGMALGVGIGVFTITHLLETYPIHVWSFFFGLIVASAIHIGKQINFEKKVATVFAVIIGAVIAYTITVLAPTQGPRELWFVLISGFISISALMLPGISGSFILLLLGMYLYIIPNVKDAIKTFNPESIKILLVFGLGALLGVATFSRVLSWLFKHYKNITLSLLTGFLLGSLNKIWPWQQVLETRITEKGEEKILFTKSILPGQMEKLSENFFYGTEAYLTGAILMMITGFLIVILLERLSLRNETGIDR